MICSTLMPIAFFSPHRAIDFIDKSSEVNKKAVSIALASPPLPNQSPGRIQDAINDLEKEKRETAETLSRDSQAIQKNKISHRKLAAQAGIDPANLYKTLMGKRHPSAEMLAKLQHILCRLD